MAAKLTRLTHKIAIQLRLVAEIVTICSSRSRRASPETFGYTLVSLSDFLSLLGKGEQFSLGGHM
jgi:hypothetical protein